MLDVAIWDLGFVIANLESGIWHSTNRRLPSFFRHSLFDVHDSTFDIPAFLPLPTARFAGRR